MKRRTFVSSTLATLGAAAFGGCGGLVSSRKSPRWDVLIRGGRIYDGTGGEGKEGGLACVGGRIVAIGQNLQGSANHVVDATGHAVVPGFIDLHNHADGTLFADPLTESVVRQGITTIIVGQDGFAPSSESGEEAVFDSFTKFFTAVEALPPSVNVASMVGLGALRRAHVGMADRPATPDELQRMVAAVEAAIQAGVCGASTGLEYIPGAFATRDELIALCRPLARLGLPYASHMRNEDDQLLVAIDEAIAIGRGAGCTVHISHLKTMGARNWPKIDAVFERIASARASGLDLTFDRYPYTAAATSLQNLYPAWSRAGGGEAFIDRFNDRDTHAKMRAATLAKVDLIGGWDKIVITSVKNPEDKAIAGQRLDQYARANGLSPYDATVALLQRNAGDVGMVEFMMSEENLVRFLQHPHGLVCSDGGAYALTGPAHRDHPHPRSLGSFPRVLGRYVREEKALTFTEAIRKMTSAAADRVKLKDRGRLMPGYAADIVILDPAQIRDRATYEDPFHYPEGIKAVFVNGEPALLDGVRSSRRTGRVLRPHV